MSTDLISRGANFESAGIRKVSLPVYQGLEYAGFLNSSLGKARANFVYDKKDGIAVGLPTALAHYSQFRGASSFINSRVPEYPAMTVFMVCRSLDTFADLGTAPAYFGNWISGTTPGLSMWTPISSAGNGSVQVRAYRGDTSEQVGVLVADISSWGLYIATIPNDGTGVTRVDAVTQGASSLGTLATERIVRPSPLRIGSLDSSSVTGTSEVACCLAYSRALDTDERADMAAWIQSYMAGHGIIV